MIISTEAISISSLRYGDSSKIVRWVTKDKGLISTIAKGALSKKSRFKEAIQLFNIAKINYYERESGLNTLSVADVLQNNFHLQFSAESSAIAMMISESILQKEEENQISNKLFHLLASSLTLLDSQKIKSPYSIFIYFQLNYASLLGFEAFKEADFSSYSEESLSVQIYNGEITEDSRKIGFRFETNLLEKGYRCRINDIDYLTNVGLDDKEMKIWTQFFEKYFSFHLEKKVSYKAFNLLTISL